jgi:hypothetical protein
MTSRTISSVRGRDQHLLEDAEVALPDDRDAVEDRRKEHALREDARRHEVQVSELSRGDGTRADEDLAEHQQP